MTLLLAADLLLLLGATLRVVRLIVADDFPGLWLIRHPAMRWARRHDTQTLDPHRWRNDRGPGWRSKLITGLSCPFCIGLWIAAGMVLLLTAVGGPGQAPDWWRIGAGILALNWVAAHIGVRAGDTEDD